MTGQDVVRLIVMHPAQFALGYDEGLESMGMTYDDDSGSDRSIAYDLGRSLRQGVGSMTLPDEHTLYPDAISQVRANRLAWIEALESGDYIQTTGMLHRFGTDDVPDQFCCLGVACDLAYKAGVAQRRHQVDRFSYHGDDGDNTASTLPDVVSDWLGISTDNPCVWAAVDGSPEEFHEVTSLNDVVGLNFAQIAALVRKELL
jgi:hypothetical protein